MQALKLKLKREKTRIFLFMSRAESLFICQRKPVVQYRCCLKIRTENPYIKKHPKEIILYN